MRQNGEASVEEILESIKKVIARDNRAGAVELRRRRENDGLPEPAGEDEADEILDLAAADFVDGNQRVDIAAVRRRLVAQGALI